VQRPFAVRYSAGEPLGLLECRLVFCAESPAEAVLAAESAMHRFFELANTGALAGADVSPAACGIGEIRLHRFDSGLAASFRDVRLDTRSLPVLVNIVHALHEKVLRVRELHVGWEAIARMPDPAELAFPPPHANPPFAWMEDEDLGTVFDIIIDFAAAQDAKGLRLATTRTAAWLVAVASGAYGDEALAPHGQGVDFSTEPMTWTEDSLVWYFDRFASGPQALDGLKNLLVRLHGDGVPVAAVELSE
jgi:hypothetical protein